MKRALITKQDIKEFIFDAICELRETQIVNRAGICKALNITEYQLKLYLQQGMPWIGKHTRKKFNINECRKWINANQ